MDQPTMMNLGDQITINHLRSLLEVQTNLRDQAEQRWRSAQIILIELFNLVAADHVNQLARSGESVEQIPFEVMVGSLKSRIRELNEISSKVQRPQIENAEEVITRALSQVSMMRSEIKKLNGQLESLQSAHQKLLADYSALKKGKVDIRKDGKGDPGQQTISDKPPKEGGYQEPEWMLLWRTSKNFNRDSWVLTMIGKAGISRRPEIEARIGNHFEIASDSGSIVGLLTRLRKNALITIEDPWDSKGASSGGRNPQLIQLTDRGRQAYWLLTGENPIVSEFEIKETAHVTPEHTLLNIQAIELLKKEGYTIVNEAPSIPLPDGGKFIPDIVAQKDSQTIFVEVERGTSKDIGYRKIKWLNFYQVSGGKIFVICDNRDCMGKIRAEINHALGLRKAKIFITNLFDLQDGKRGQDGSLWLAIKGEE